MAMEVGKYNLVLTFNTEVDEPVKFTIPNVKAGLTKPEISALMDVILAQNIIESTKGNLTAKVSGEVKQLAQEKFEF